MFSFHKPKIYRSLLGCCICKAKSSSSRFTDSKKYEAEFEKCFRTPEKRSGEICNACVLLVKRWKKLPPGTQRDWRHVVDARAGPGTKTSGGKISSKNSSLRKHTSPKPKKVAVPNDDMMEDSMSDCRVLLGRRIVSPDRSDSSDDENMDEDFYLSDHEDFDGNDSRDKRLKAAPDHQQISQEPLSRGRAAYLKTLKKRSHHESLEETFVGCTTEERVSSFLDMTFWRREKICCGVIFKGPNEEVVIIPKLLKPCQCRTKSSSPTSLASSIPKTPNGSDNMSLSSSSIFSPSRLEEDNESNASSSNSALT